MLQAQRSLHLAYSFLWSETHVAHSNCHIYSAEYSVAFLEDQAADRRWRAIGGYASNGTRNNAKGDPGPSHRPRGPRRYRPRFGGLASDQASDLESGA